MTPASLSAEVLFDHHPLPMWIFDRETLAFLAVNDAAVERYGWTREEFLEMTIRDIRPEEDVDRLEDEVHEAMPDLLRTGGWRHLTREGEIRHVEVAGHSITYRGREARLVVVWDLTDRHRMQEELARSEERYRSLVEHHPDAVYSFDLDGTFRSANDACEKVSGYRPEELVGSDFEPLLVPEDRERVREHFEAAAVGDTRHYEAAIHHRDGRRVELSVTNVPIRVGGDVVGVYGIARDVTGRKELQRTLERRTRRYETLLANLTDVVTLLDEEGKVRYVSPSFQRIFGHDPEERVGRPVTELVHPDDVERVVAELTRGMDEAGEVRTAEFRLRHADGSWRPVEARGVLIDAGDLTGPLIVTRDVSERRALEEKYSAIFWTNPSAVSVATLEGGRFVEVNHAFAELYGHAREDVLGATAGELELWGSPEARRRFVEQVVETGTVRNYETALHRADGGTVEVLLSGSVLATEEEDFLVTVAQDIRELKAFEAQLRRKALYDDLTGLPNRTLLRDRLAHALERSEREGDLVAVLFLDLDRFKDVNDSLGHPAGDRVLRAVADRLTTIVREQDTVARFGGDEFTILLEGLEDPEAIEAVGRRLRAAFDRPFTVREAEFSLSASIGVAHSRVPFDGPDDLIRLADAAMYRTKGAASTGFHVYEAERDAELTTRLHREAELRRAVEGDQLVVHYQPVYRLPDLEVVAAEALVRWDHPERGLVSPAEFIPLAEDTGLIVPLGHQVLHGALGDGARWRDRGLVDDAFRMSVNFSARQVQEPDLAERIHRAAGDAGFPLSRLTVEITESIIVGERGQMDALRRSGVRVAIDDFGTGYSSLQYLRQISADALKLDRSFVEDLDATGKSPAIVRAVLYVAEAFGIDVVAEGIETEGQLRALVEGGCAMGQGYYFARPMPAGELERLLEGGPASG